MFKKHYDFQQLQTACFPHFRRSLTFTILLWINSTAVSGGGTIVHVSSDQNGNGTIVVQTVQNSTLTAAFAGSILATNTWTHLALVFSSRNGIRFYVNGTLSNAQPNIANILAFWSFTSSQLYITLGNSQITAATVPSCEKGTLPIVSGAIDECRLCMTELNGEEICTFANP
ncbi:unnamed protein product [Rotaria socialis]|uniref:Lectin n=1 Tax=Rotaria socialis TaxID=392032 RepID=A0A821S3Y4_9BILA|nr:unnamed protein product [Rotaria socialis]CAF4852142.1 unnamed protein product [Rotaria socialis]